MGDGRQERRSRGPWLNPRWLIHNIATSWRHRASLADFVRRVLLLYSSRLPRFLRPADWIIGFRYRAPIGNVRLLLRDNGGSDLFIHSEVFEHEYYRVPLARPPATILDLGANIGLAAIYFSRLFPGAELACVEPIPANLRLLAHNLRLNDTRAAVIPAAADANDGRVTMEMHVRDHEHKIATAGAGSSRPTLDVEAISVPTILRRLGWDRIGLLKVDIEGHEAALFTRNCDWLSRVDAMCIECHDGFGDADLAALARQFGFAEPRRLPGTWFLSRAMNAASAA